MAVPHSVEELLQLIRKSGMVDESKLVQYLQRRRLTRGWPDDVREFADELVRDGILTQFQAEQFLLGKWRGFVIGKYKLLERVGVGGMGQVFLGEHLYLRKRVAIKVLPPAKAEHPAALGRFYREARAAAGLDHPNIVRTHDIDQDGSLHFIVMDYVNGPNLLDVVKRFGPLDVGRAVSYVRQIALGLDYAFRNRIVHRDVKPGNILIDRRGRARLLDMGLARFLNDHTDQLTIKYDDKIVLGTADYVAPEQVANSHTVDIRADIYGLGATLYFLLAGHPPFPTGTVSQKLLWHRTKDPTPIRSIRPEVPDGLAAVLAKMMAKDPRARYQVPAQVAAALEAWLPPVVPLPAEAEMPQLSPAAAALVQEIDDEPAEEATPPAGATPSAGAVAEVGDSRPAQGPTMIPVTTAAIPPPRFGPFAPAAPPAAPAPPSGPAPFGPTGYSPWASTSEPSRAAVRPTAPAPPPPAAPPRAVAPPLVVPVRHTLVDVNPFAADATTPQPSSFPWVTTLAGLLVVAAVAVAAVLWAFAVR